MQAQQAPEVLRTPLESLCLTVRAAVDATRPIAETLDEMLTPPDAASVRSAVANLSDLGALDTGQALTPLGIHMSRMPMDARLAKMLLYGALLR